MSRTCYPDVYLYLESCVFCNCLCCYHINDTYSTPLLQFYVDLSIKPMINLKDYGHFISNVLDDQNKRTIYFPLITLYHIV